MSTLPARHASPGSTPDPRLARPLLQERRDPNKARLRDLMAEEHRQAGGVLFTRDPAAWARLAAVRDSVHAERLRVGL